MSIRKINEAWIGEQFTVCIANSDFTGLSDRESEQFDAWERQIAGCQPGQSHKQLILTNEREEFKKCEITGLHGDCVKVEVWERNAGIPQTTTTTPRLAENPDQLYREIRKLTRYGHVTKRHGIRYPVVAVGSGDHSCVYSIDDEGIHRLRGATKELLKLQSPEWNHVHEAIEQDKVTVYIPEGVLNLHVRLEVLHEPRAKSCQ